MRAANPVPILYLIDKLHRAGAQNNLSQLALGIDRDRFTPAVCCLTRGGPVANDIERAGVEVTVLGIGRIYTPHAWYELKRLAARMREREVQLIHTYMASSNLFGTVAARMAEVPVALTTRRDMGFSRSSRLRWLEETFINSRVSRVVVPCEAIAEVTRREKHLEPAKIVTIPNGIDSALWQWDERERREGRERLGLTGDDRAVGVIANFLPVKGHADFLEAAAVVLAARRQTKIFLAGDGEIRRQIEAMAARLGLTDRVSFLGRWNDTRKLLATLDLCVLPSRSEGMSNVLMEAMAMERPIVATAVGGNTELLEHEVTGLLVPPRDPKALASAMLTLLESPERASRMGREARRVVESRYSLDAMVAQYETLYDSLLVPSTAP